MATLVKNQRSFIEYGEPPQPAHPAYCVKRIVDWEVSYERIRPGNIAIGGGPYRVTIETVNAAGERRLVQYWVATIEETPSGALVEREFVTPIYEDVCFPAFPGSPGVSPETTFLPGDGWNAGARSIDLVSVGCRFKAAIPLGRIGAIVGLLEGVEPPEQYAFGGAALAVAFTAGGVAQVLVSGAVAGVVDAADNIPHVVEFRRSMTAVEVIVDGEAVFIHDVAEDLVLHGAAVLYAATDSVTDALIEPLMMVDGVMGFPAPSLQGSDADVHGELIIPAPILEADGVYSAGYNYARLQQPAPGLHGVVEYEPPVIGYGGGTLAIPPPMIFGESDQWTLLRGTLNVPAFTMVGADVVDYNYGALKTSIPTAIDLSVNEDPSGAETTTQLVVVQDNFTLTAPVMIAFAERLRVGEIVDFVLVFGFGFAERLGVDDEISFSASDSITFSEAIRFSDTSTMGRSALTYAVDIVTGALREYSDYEFTHYMNLGTDLWAARPDGIYRLSARSEASQALLDLGVLDFGAGQQKRIATSWVGVRTDGQVYLRVTVDGRDYVYRAEPHGDDVQRIGIGKGLSARHWKMRLEIEDATFASIDSVEFELGVSQRRKEGRRR